MIFRMIKVVLFIKKPITDLYITGFALLEESIALSKLLDSMQPPTNNETNVQEDSNEYMSEILESFLKLKGML